MMIKAMANDSARFANMHFTNMTKPDLADSFRFSRGVLDRKSFLMSFKPQLGVEHQAGPAARLADRYRACPEEKLMDS
jgi:hypothetical protein